MTIARVIEMIEEATLSVPGLIDASTELASTDVWDSLSMVRFIAMLKDQTGIELTADDMKASATPLALLAAIAGKSGP